MERILLIALAATFVAAFGVQDGTWGEAGGAEFRIGMLYSSRGGESFRPVDVHARLRRCFRQEYATDRMADEAAVLAHRHLDSAYGLTLSRAAAVLVYDEYLESMSHTLNLCSHCK